MIDFIKKYLNINTIDLISSVPLHKSKIRERGFNQAEILAEHIAIGLKKKYDRGLLIRNKKTITHFLLDQNARFKNLAAAFKCRDTACIKGKSVLLVDDIFTSGATANECAKAIKQAGALKVNVITMAR
ncbi:MAG: ComF family protein [Candidatus Omnitrophica bacterium]|nr:ComF family protein [Candidatus Omnitrophota bacterium]